jgi:hypothetical protein
MSQKLIIATIGEVLKGGEIDAPDLALEDFD